MSIDSVLAVMKYLPPWTALMVAFIVLICAALVLPVRYIWKAVDLQMKFAKDSQESFAKSEELMKQRLDKAEEVSAVLEQRTKSYEDSFITFRKQITSVVQLFTLAACENAPTCIHRIKPEVPQFGEYCNDCEYDSCLECPLAKGFTLD